MQSVYKCPICEDSFIPREGQNKCSSCGEPIGGRQESKTYANTTTHKSFTFEQMGRFDFLWREIVATTIGTVTILIVRSNPQAFFILIGVLPLFFWRFGFYRQRLKTIYEGKNKPSILIEIQIILYWIINVIIPISGVIILTIKNSEYDKANSIIQRERQNVKREFLSPEIFSFAPTVGYFMSYSPYSSSVGPMLFSILAFGLIAWGLQPYIRSIVQLKIKQDFLPLFYAAFWTVIIAATYLIAKPSYFHFITKIIFIWGWGLMQWMYFSKKEQ